MIALSQQAASSTEYERGLAIIIIYSFRVIILFTIKKLKIRR